VTPDQRGLPPVSEVAVAVIAVVVCGGIYLAAYLPRRAPLGPAFAMLGVAAALLAWNVVSLARLRRFAWRPFFLVGRWALAAYLVIAGMLEYVFVFDHTSGSILVVLTLMLAIFAVNIPLLLAFSVARYQPPDA
jgi:peptidoglycan/LPS O-acetylase OafA/YrhL